MDWETREYQKISKSIKTKRDVELGKMKIDVSKFILKTQARAKYSEDKELETLLSNKINELKELFK